jgi:hypothetical protein
MPSSGIPERNQAQIDPDLESVTVNGKSRHH